LVPRRKSVRGASVPTVNRLLLSNWLGLAHGLQWRFLHAVPIGERGVDIDHVAIGPAGVFPVNAEHHPHASVWVGGHVFMVNASACRSSATVVSRRAALLSCSANELIPCCQPVASLL